MRKNLYRMLFLALPVLMLCACSGKENGAGEELSDTWPVAIEDAMQESFEVGGITISASDGLNQTLTGTELTDAVEALLYEKYGREFVCEQYLYYIEFGLNMDLTAYPKDDPNLRFALDVTGKDTLEIWYDDYYNELHRDEIDDYLHQAAAFAGIARDEFFANINYMITTDKVTSETFVGEPVDIYISVSEERAEQLHEKMRDIISSLYSVMHSREDFWVYVCDEGTSSIKDMRYDRILKSYRVQYGEDMLYVYWNDSGDADKSGSWEIPIVYDETRTDY